MAKAVLLLRERVVLSETTFADIMIWRVSKPVRSSTHHLRYSLALIDERRCVLRYDNEAEKGDHLHTAEDTEAPYDFRGIDPLIEDFWESVDEWMTKTKAARGP